MIVISNNSWSLKQLKTMYRNKKVRFDHPIQRGEDQWDVMKKSLLVHTAASSFPILPVFAVSKKEIVDDKSVTVRYILDGKQRLTNMFSYIDNYFATIDMVDEVSIEGDEFTIASKEFDELDDEVQDAILSKMITVYTIDGELATDEEIEDVFFRMNYGTPLTKSQLAKAKMGVMWAKTLKEVAEHKVITEYSAFSKAQLSGEKQISALLQTMMMLDNYQYKDVSEKSIAEYAMTFKDDDSKNELFSRVCSGLDYLSHVFDSKEKILMKKVHFPTVLTSAIFAIDNGYSVPEFQKWIEFFKEEFSKKEKDEVEEKSLSTNYFDFTGKGSTEKRKAVGRMEEMRRHLTAYITNERFHEVTDRMAKDAYDTQMHHEKDLPF